MVEVEGERVERGAPDAYRAAFKLRYYCSGFNEHVEYGYVGLDGFHVKPFYLGASRDCARHKERSRRAPVFFYVKVGGFVALGSAHLEGDAGAAAPIFIFKHLCIAFHLAAGADPKVPQHVEGDVHVGDALWVADVKGAVFGTQGESHQQARNELRAAFAAYFGVAGDEASAYRQGHPDFASGALVEVVQQHTEGCHYGCRFVHGTASECAVAFQHEWGAVDGR